MPPEDRSSGNLATDISSDLLNGEELRVSNSTAKRDFLKLVFNWSSVSVSSLDSGVWIR